MAVFNGTNAADWFDGTALRDTMFGRGGNDVLLSHEGNDRIIGGLGDDYIESGDGNDRVGGGSGNDVIFGDYDYESWLPGNDYLHGDAGNDYIEGAAGNDLLFGGAGDDTLVAFGHAEGRGGAGNDSLQLYGTGHAWGNSGDDFFYDWLGQGELIWSGNADADLFHIDMVVRDGATRNLTITDFKPGEGDRLAMGAYDGATDWWGNSEDVFNALDTNHDGVISGLQQDGAGDMWSRHDAASNTLINYIGDDVVAVSGVSAIDWSMVA